MTTSPYDENPARRPGLNDFGGGAKEDELGYEPNPVTQATAKDFNQLGNGADAFARLTPVAIVTVHIVSGSPVIFSVTAAGRNIDSSDFTLTPVSAGISTVVPAAGALPPPAADHKSSVTGATPGYATTETLALGARVRTLNAAGTLAYLPYVLELW